jgi:hypothetical protein
MGKIVGKVSALQITNFSALHTAAKHLQVALHGTRNLPGNRIHEMSQSSITSILPLTSSWWFLFTRIVQPSFCPFSLHCMPQT